MSEDIRCGKQSAFAYYWPNKPESHACEEHAAQIQGIGNAIGLYIHMKPDTQHTCQQIIEKKERQP